MRKAVAIITLLLLLPLLTLQTSVIANEEDGVSAPLRVRSSITEIMWESTQGEEQPTNVSIIGEWNWSIHTNLTYDSSSGIWSTSLELASGLYCYKFVVGESDYRFDTTNPSRGYCGGIENSLLKVSDHTRPSFEVEFDEITGLPNRILLYSGSGGITIETGGPQFDSGYYPSVSSFDMSTEAWDLDLSVLPEGKHTIHVNGTAEGGGFVEDLILPFWIGDQEEFEWEDALIYMVMTDRFVNGNSSNDGPSTGAAAEAEWQGGDFEGITQMIESGYFNEIGVNALWISPFNTNPNGSYIAGDGEHMVSGYHGYWPIEPRQVDSRYGGEEALENLVDAAHEAGIRIVADFVVNHVHEEHIYFQENPEWFNDGCLCGTSQCDWTERRLDCLFMDYMPDVDWTNRDASEQIISDALWWIERFDLDGMRVDAVKHVDDLAITNLATRINDRFETAGNDFHLKGETAMGWSGHTLEENAEQYGTINRYIGPNALDGQADFVLYHAVIDNVLASGNMDYQHLDYWTNRSQDQYVEGAVMNSYFGSHDTPRFISRAEDSGTQWNQWAEQARPGTPSTEAYDKARQAIGWLLTTPGAPILYMGDEFGQPGGADPDNRRMIDFNFSDEEWALRNFTSELAQLRLENEPLRRGTYSTFHVSADLLVFEMTTGTDSNMVVLNRGYVDQLEIPYDEVIFGDATLFDDALAISANSVTVLRHTSVPSPLTDCVTLNLSIISTPEIYDSLTEHFPKAISVFGVHLLATSGVDDDTLLHAAAVMAGYLDDDSDGIANDPAVVQAMVDANAAMVIPRTEYELEMIIEELPESFHVKMDEGEFALQDLYEDEIHPGGRSANGFDATLEEVLHLITHVGYATAYPDDFAEVPGSTLTIAMDEARGGHYEEDDIDDCEEEEGPCALPTGGYSESSWYHYDDGTCDYSCMATEYLYWALTTHLGAQSNSGRCYWISEEWEPCTREQLAQIDPAIVSLLESSTLARSLPSGEHCPDDPIDNDIQGCMNVNATNYNQNATVDDGSCVMPQPEPEPEPEPEGNNESDPVKEKTSSLIIARNIIALIVIISFVSLVFFIQMNRKT